MAPPAAELMMRGNNLSSRLQHLLEKVESVVVDSQQLTFGKGHKSHFPHLN